MQVQPMMMAAPVPMMAMQVPGGAVGPDGGGDVGVGGGPGGGPVGVPGYHVVWSDLMVGATSGLVGLPVGVPGGALLKESTSEAAGLA
jgi:hypothetical protein